MSVHLLLATAALGTGTPKPVPAPPTKFVDLAPLRLNFQPTSLGALQDTPAEADPGTDDFDRTIVLETPPEFGTKGTKRWYLQFAYGADPGDTGANFQLGGVGFNFFFADALSLNLEFNGMYVSQSGPSTGGFNFNLLFQWHFLRERKWSMFADAGAGLLLTLNDVPEDGSSFNFTPQAGLGCTFDVGRDVRLVLGARWQHISNANLFADNPGRDNVMGYVAVSFPF